MVVGKSIFGMLTNNDEMSPNRGGIVFHSEVVIGYRITDLRIRTSP